MAIIDKDLYCYRYPHPALTADAVVMGLDGQRLAVLLIERGSDPYKGAWALPGGFMEIDETVEECVARELCEETGLRDIALEQLHTYSRVDRDTRERVVTVAFYGLVGSADCRAVAGDDAAQAQWHAIDCLPPLAFDHDEIIAHALDRLREVIQARQGAYRRLAERFSEAELRAVEAALSGPRPA